MQILEETSLLRENKSRNKPLMQSGILCVCVCVCGVIYA